MTTKLLVAIANHGTKNDTYCKHLIDTYQAMAYDVDIVVLSNIDKDYGSDVEVAIGAPTKDPWSLPFAHRQLFIDRQDEYDLFLYTEDDTEVLPYHLDLFEEALEHLGDDVILGFIRRESDASGGTHYSTVHHVYHWQGDSVIEANGKVYARYTNEHSGCYVVSQAQLKRCIASGGYPVEPHARRYDLLVSAATDPYTTCGLTKVVCISDLRRYSLHHLPDAYIDRIGVEEADVDRQVAEVRRAYFAGDPWTRLFNPTTAFEMMDSNWDKSFYEPLRENLVEVIVEQCGSILSIGCDLGASERELSKRGVDVATVPMDSIIAEGLRGRGIETTSADLDSAIGEMGERTFDAILFNRSLAYFPDPVATLRATSALLGATGRVFVVFDNRERLANLKPSHRRHLRRLRREGFDGVGVHWTDRHTIGQWLRNAGFVPGDTWYVAPPKYVRLAHRTRGLIDRWLGETAITVATAPSESRSGHDTATRKAST